MSYTDYFFKSIIEGIDIAVTFGIIFFIIIMPLFILFIVASTMRKSKRIKKMETCLSNMANFNVTQKIISPDGLSGLAIDAFKKEICLIKNKDNMISLHKINYSELISSKIYKKKFQPSNNRSSMYYCLSLTINNIKEPLHEIKIITAEKANYWQNLLIVIIHNNNT